MATRRAAEAANRQSRRRYQIEPFSPNDFHRATDKSRVVYIALVGMGLGDMQAEVCFDGDKPAEVVLTVLTNRIVSPKFRRPEIPPAEVRQVPPDIKIEGGGKKGQ